MKRIKSNWKFIVYWTIVMSVTNIYIIPKFVDHEPITSKRILVGFAVSLLGGLIMGLILSPKPKQD